MISDLSFDTDRNLAIVTVGRSLTVQDFKAAIRRIVTSDQVAADADAVWDLREIAEDAVSSGSLKYLAGLRNAFGRIRGHSRIGIVVSRSMHIHAVNLFSTYMKDHGQQLAIFLDVDSARAWIACKRYEDRSAAEAPPDRAGPVPGRGPVSR